MAYSRLGNDRLSAKFLEVGWRSRWTVYLGAGEAHHKDGWVFAFSKNDGKPVGWFDAVCIKIPNRPVTYEEMRSKSKLAYQAAFIYEEERAKRH